MRPITEFSLWRHSSATFSFALALVSTLVDGAAGPPQPAISPQRAQRAHKVRGDKHRIPDCASVNFGNKECILRDLFVVVKIQLRPGDCPWSLSCSARGWLWQSAVLAVQRRLVRWMRQLFRATRRAQTLSLFTNSGKNRWMNQCTPHDNSRRFPASTCWGHDQTRKNMLSRTARSAG